MVKVETSLMIERPVEEVFAYMNDPKNDALWQDGVLESEAISEGPLGVGSELREVRNFLGRRLESTSEITEFELNRKVSWKATSGPIPLEASITFESVEGGTKVSVVGEADVGGIFKLAEPMVARSAQKQFDGDFAKLKEILEAGA
jgi:uncharacterized membrane protein